MPVQVWATWFPTGQTPQTFIQGFPLSDFSLSKKGESPFAFRVGESSIGEDLCRGALNVDGHRISWNLRYRSTFRVTLSSKGWIGFSRTPHSDAVFSGQISLDDRRFTGNPLGFGVQGHNCGYRHRNFWRWMHAYFPRNGNPPTTLEALAYEMPFGLVFRKAVFWHDSHCYIFRNLREFRTRAEEMQWDFAGSTHAGVQLQAAIDGRGTGLHRLPYSHTNCSGTFEVLNNSLAAASMVISRPHGLVERLETTTGAVLEMVG
jgi:hypothetical protein